MTIIHGEHEPEWMAKNVMYLQKATLQISFQAFNFEVFKLIYGRNDTFHLRKRQRRKKKNWIATHSFCLFSSVLKY